MRLRHPAVIGLLLAPLAVACATSPQPDSGFLTSYAGLQADEDSVRASARVSSDAAGLAGIERVVIEPAVFHPDAATATGDLSEADRALVLGEVERQLCYELSERYIVVSQAEGAGAARVRTAVTAVWPTGQVGSVASAAANFFIPGPIGLRPPVGLGGLAAEAEMLTLADGRQVGAIVWARRANAVGTDTPSLSRVGDALQFAEPFGDVAAAAFTAEGREARGVDDPDPCAAYGDRTQPAGFIGRVVTGLYSPTLSGAGGEDTEDAAEVPQPTQPD